jgi:hypothetical protein
MTGTDINAAWRKPGRPRICNYLISKMVRARKRKATPHIPADKSRERRALHSSFRTSTFILLIFS